MCNQEPPEGGSVEQQLDERWIRCLAIILICNDDNTLVITKVKSGIGRVTATKLSPIVKTQILFYIVDGWYHSYYLSMSTFFNG